MPELTVSESEKNEAVQAPGSATAKTANIEAVNTILQGQVAAETAAETVQNEQALRAALDRVQDSTLWQQQRESDEAELRQDWTQLAERDEEELKETFRDLAEFADKVRGQLVDAITAEAERVAGENQSASTEELRDLLNRLDQLQEEMDGARRDVAVAVEEGAERGPGVVADACQSLDERAAEILALIADQEAVILTNADIARAVEGINETNPGFTLGNLREMDLRLDIDEIVAVSNGGAWDDAANKQFLERAHNQNTKNDLADQRELVAQEPISLREAKEAGEAAFRKAAEGMLTGRFSDVEELEAIYDAARAAMRNLDREERDLANALNAAIRNRIERAATEEAALVREALEELGIELMRKRNKV